jgi:hypothetical protein
MNRWTKERNSMRNTRSRSAVCLPRHRGVIGMVNAKHALSDQAIATIAM